MFLIALLLGVFVTLPPAKQTDQRSLRAHAAIVQADLTAWLQAERVEVRRFWISNRLYLPKPTPDLLRRLRNAGYSIEEEQLYHIPEPIPGPQMAAPQGVEWGIKMIRAPEVWGRGHRGKGVVIGQIDTGFDPAHPAIRSKWRGAAEGRVEGNWKDPTRQCGISPCDNQGHGTHITGTLVGDDGGGNQIGVAPEAQFIACKGCESSSCTESSLIACAEWMVDPREDGSGRDRPKIVSNSWGGPPASTWFNDVLKAWSAAGILPVFAAGNNGSGCDSVTSPGDRPEAVAVAAIDSNGAVAYFSSRGPSRVDGGQKPQLSAPGVNVRSSTPNGGYQAYSGTSMATPHLAGVVALLCELDCDPVKLRKVLEESAIPRPLRACGEDKDSPNYTYGYGIVDVLAALERLEVPPPPPPPVVPAPPTGLVGREINGLIALTWKPSAGATHYTVQMHWAGGWLDIGSSPDPNYTHVPVWPGIWWFHVRAANDSGSSAHSAFVGVEAGAIR